MIDLNYQHQTVRLETSERYGRRLPLETCAQVMTGMSPLFRYSLRMAVEGASASRGVRPRWLERASDIRFVDYSANDGDTLLHLEAPVLGDAAPELFEQPSLWKQGPSHDSTAIDLLGAAVCDVRDKNADSALYDRPLLARLAHLRPVLERRIRAVRVPAHTNGRTDVALDETVVSSARELSDRTPAPQEVRVVGVLDMIRHSTRSFALKMKDGSEVRGVLETSESMERIRHLLSERVLVLGRAVYRPSGSVLRLEARAVEAGAGQSELWEKIPAPRSRQRRSVRFKPGEAQSWLDSFFGKWPGDETDEDFDRMLREVRG